MCSFSGVWYHFGLVSKLQKLVAGGLPERILTAFQSVFEDHPNEDTAYSKYGAAVQQLTKIMEDVENSLNQGMGPAVRLVIFSVKISYM